MHRPVDRPRKLSSVGYSLRTGLSTYVWRRQGDFGLATSRVVSATVANDQVNMLTLRNATTQNPAFNQPLVLISTADGATFETIRLAFMEAGGGGACPACVNHVCNVV